MTDPISAIGNTVAQTTRPMAMTFTNPVGSSNAPLEMSDFARATLSQVNEMQTSYNREVRAAQETSQKVASADPATLEPDMRLAEAARAMGGQIEAATRVQEQLARFVMASSVSSSFGRNLNMFLRGQ